MDLETFTWPVRPDVQGQVTFRTLTAQFGDGYSQQADDGINVEKQSWPVTLVGTTAELEPVKDFLRRHRGVTRFYWTPPDHSKGIYKVTGGYGYVAHGAGNCTITATFELSPVP
ncbi:phage tail protein [Pandoraea pneumonica]|uniref:Phage tail protein n=1 Tax=Pandoraea pneumonica TaxID=2508299 RepID=A0A5E4WV40_9BURK|nr:phage tail protein [Pandoraea pneumonica]VVE28143.1 phage tail protein [Pandoraea pneumonica]